MAGGFGAAWAAAAFLSSNFRSIVTLGFIIWFVDRGDSASIVLSQPCFFLLFSLPLSVNVSRTGN